MAEKLLFVLYYYKTYPTFDVLGTQFDMVRSKANENLHKLSPLLYDTLVYLELMPHREFDTPEAMKAALQGIDQVIIDATERAYRRSQEDAKQREHYSGKKNDMSVHEMSSESKWREMAVSGCKGPSAYGRNLGTSAQCSDGGPRQEDPHGSARY